MSRKINFLFFYFFNFLILIFPRRQTGAVNIQTNPDKRERRNKKAAAVRNKGQRNARHRQEADTHADIDKNLDKNQNQNQKSEEHGEIIRRAGSDPIEAIKNKTEKSQEQADADKAELFGDDREDKIGLAFGNEFQLALRAETESPAKKFSRADRDERLLDIVTAAKRIGRGTHESDQP